MNRAVLADLQRGEVEPERLELPAEVLDVAPRDPAEAIGDERLLDLGQLRIELVRGVVAARERRLLAGQERAGPAEALRDEAEPLAVRLAGESAAELAIELRQEVGVAGEARGRAADRARRRFRMRRPSGTSRVATAS